MKKGLLTLLILLFCNISLFAKQIGSDLNVFTTIQAPNCDISASLTTTDSGTEPSGSVEIMATGGTAVYLYELYRIKDPNIVTTSQSNIFTDLEPGYYAVNITSEKYCTVNKEFIIYGETSNLDLSATATTITYNDCTTVGANITITGSGGKAPYLYYTNSSAKAPTGEFFVTREGTYTFFVEDADGNQIELQETITITVPDPTTFTTNIIGSESTPNGSVEIIANGGTPPYQYSLINADNSNIVRTGTNLFNEVEAGRYIVEVGDANDCFTRQNITVDLIDQITLTPSVRQIRCKGINDGAITIWLTGGTAPYTVSLNGGPRQNSLSFNNLGPGDYSVNVIDANNIEETTFITITEPDALVANTTIINSGLEPSAIIYTEPTGGTAPYTHDLFDAISHVLLDDYKDNNFYSNLPAGTYELFITDENGCGLLEVIDIMEVALDNSISIIEGKLTVNTEADSYQWINNITGEEIEGETSKTLSINSLGEYRVEMTVTIPARFSNNARVANQTITLSSETFTVTEDTLGLDKPNNKNSISVYPNPATDVLNLPDSTTNQEYTILSILGKQITSGTILNKKVNISNLAKGIYFLKIDDLGVAKFIKN